MEQPLAHNHKSSFAALTDSESNLKGGFRVPLNILHSHSSHLKLYWVLAVPESAALEARIAVTCEQTGALALPPNTSLLQLTTSSSTFHGIKHLSSVLHLSL